MAEHKPQLEDPPYKYESVAGSEEEAKARSDGRVEISIGQVEMAPASRAFLYIAACTGSLFFFLIWIVIVLQY